MIILCVLYCKRKKSETYPSGAVENGTSMQTFNVNDHNAAATNAYETTQDEKPPYRNGQPAETYRPQSFTDGKPKQDVTLAQEAIALEEKVPSDEKPNQDVTLDQKAIELEEKVPIDEKPKQDVTLEQQAIELENKVPNDANPEPKKETEGGDQNDGSNQTDNDTGGKNEVPENAQTNNNSTSPKDNLV
ncbi:uncharacterized protein LOC116308724 isoform X3 [Actinia tenebrosa]|uniref:Uncharacterized protein LOC116308724 isoform X3 n=1 Tax=Actinia tenebrosa TaxID=6105 RepID=A0A6P8JFC7_ACTTE|nr:uncharacterized protein LOC116308724 isoform X3 [Actinia tenebrosa]